MDSNKNDKLEQEEKVSETAKGKQKNRKNPETLNKVVKAIQNIKKRLRRAELDETTLIDEHLFVLPPVLISQSLIPIKAPGIDIFKEENSFWLFNQDTISLKNFLKPNEGCIIFGEDAEVPNEDLFRDLIAHHVYENNLPDDEKCHSISLYVLYLMSVHSDKNFVSDCLDFLKHRRFEISAAEILPIFVNFGTTHKILVGSEIEFDLPVNYVRSVKEKGNGFPYYNVEMVANVIFHYAGLNLIKREPNAKYLLKALTRLTLDRKIRSSRLFSVFASLISVLSSQLVETFGLDEVVSCLHLKDEHVLNRVEIARVVLMPVSSSLLEALIAETINFIFKSDILKPDLLKVEDVINILRNVVIKELAPLEVYGILLLINCSLPRVTAKERQVGDINSAIIAVEASLFDLEDVGDKARLKRELAKLQNILVNSFDKTFSTDFLNLSEEEM